MTNCYYVIYKPFRVLSQFTAQDGKLTLNDLYQLPKDVYSVGRLDYDSEGMLVLTNDNYLKTKVINPKSKCRKTYFAQVEGQVNNESINSLCSGVDININGQIHRTLAADVSIMEEPDLPERIPAIRYRANIPTTWLKITISEGKNRQVRKMTASVGYPTLRLIRYSIEELNIKGFISGEIKELSKNIVYNSLKIRL